MVYGDYENEKWWVKDVDFFFFKIKKSFNVKNFFLSICILG